MKFKNGAAYHLGSLCLPTLFVVGTGLAESYSFSRTHLLQVAISWGIVALLLLHRTGFTNNPSIKSWRGGAIFAASQVCLRTASERGVTRWTASIVPLATTFALRILIQSEYSLYSMPDQSTIDGPTLGHYGRSSVAFVAAFALSSHGYSTPDSSILGLAGAALFAISIVMFEQCLGESYRSDGLANKESDPSNSARRCCWTWSCCPRQVQMTIRNGAGVISSICLLTSFWIETPYLSPVAVMPSIHGVQHFSAMTWPEVLFMESTEKIFQGLAAELLFTALLLIMLCKSNSLPTSFLYTGGVILPILLSVPSVTRIVFFVAYVVIGLLSSRSMSHSKSTPVSIWSGVFSRQNITTIVCGFSVAIICMSQSMTSSTSVSEGSSALFPFDRPFNSSSARETLDKTMHPIQQLVSRARRDFDVKLNTQSRSLKEAVAIYQQRYGIPPPPKFDVWYEFARSRDAQLIDEFDSIHDMLTPYWALSPKLLRDRVAESLGFDNSLMGVLIRNGVVTHVEGGNSSQTLDWQEDSLLRMMESFIQHLPDMDLAFNLHDEPRVVVPHDTLSKMVSLAKSARLGDASPLVGITNRFSTSPKELSSGKSITEVRSTRFNKFARQHTWSHSRLSCSPDSPSRDYSDSAADNMTEYALGELGFIYNTTAFVDICQTPSFQHSFGFFDRPNVFNIVQDLVPIFSQSKISTFQDILYPSPWYWAGKVPYNEKEDVPWNQKNATIYWRGSTTGGFSRKGGWRRQHRQRAVRILNHQSSANVLFKSLESGEWEPQSVQRGEYGDLVDVAFSHVGQCDPSDCIAQEEFFHVVPPDPQKSAWSSRLLLDVDGNAFSGRFLSFLKSRSLVMKLALFQEWHAEWLRPWVHYVPLSLVGGEWLEAVRYLSGGKGGDLEGELIGRTLATTSSQWAHKSMRKEDMEVWFFRLLLEYGRLIDDNRSGIGFVGH